MTENTIEVKNVRVGYITGDLKGISLKELCMRKLAHTYQARRFWAVDGVSFSLRSGDMLGIVGNNGAGKSTLLKIICGVMKPTQGDVAVNGRVAALLELNSGFDGDLTVRENTYLRGAFLGYSRAFMNQQYAKIIEFAELQTYDDRPFRQLSSGMQARLAFSIASMITPDVLILDEVLSVGDGAFRKRSESKMFEIIRGGSTTILVSHSMSQIRSLCNKVLWLDHGKQIAFGSTERVCDMYEQFMTDKVLPPVEGAGTGGATEP